MADLVKRWEMNVFIPAWENSTSVEEVVKALKLTDSTEQRTLISAFAGQCRKHGIELKKFLTRMPINWEEGKTVLEGLKGEKNRGKGRVKTGGGTQKG